MPPHLIDSHCHINFKAFSADYREVIARSLESGIRLVAPGSQLETSQRAVELATEFESVYAAIGLHPTHVLDETFDQDVYGKLARDPRVVAIGETGLDRYQLKTDSGDNGQAEFHKQTELFEQHLELAEAVNKPVILHCRDAYNELLGILEKRRVKVPLIIHCFLGSPDDLKRFLALGAYVGFTGVITFANAQAELLDAVRQTPIDNLLVETDAPYLAPVPHRGQRNEPAYVQYVADKVAELKSISVEAVAETTVRNAEKVFNLV